MSEHPIQGLMTTAMENIKDMIEVNTIIGDPVESPDGSVIIPVSKVGFGFAAGGSEFNGKKKDSDKDSGQSSEGSGGLPFGGGSGGGVSITPVAFLIVSAKGIKMVHLDENTHLFEKMLDFAPQVVEKIQQMIKEAGQSQKSNKQNKQNKESKGRESKDEEKPQQSIYDI